MAREPDPESRPISVAELLARRAAEADGASAETSDARPAGRRRRGSEGSVSVAELTGEIPRIRGGAHSGSFPAIDRETVENIPADRDTSGGRRRAPDPAAVDTDLTDAAPSTDHLSVESSFVPDEPHVPSSGADLFPRSDRPIASAHVDHFPRSDRPTASAHVDHFPRSEAPRTGRDGGAAWSSPTPARPDQPPATRDLNSADVRERLDRTDGRADEVTGVIPRFGATSPMRDDAPDLGAMTPEERDRAFESYRNFDDVDVEEPAPRRRRGLLGGLRRARSDDDATARPGEVVDDASIAHTDLLAGGPDDGQLHVRDDTPTELTDVSEQRDDDLPWTRRFSAADGAGVVDLDKAQRAESVRPSWRGADTTAAPLDAPDEDDTNAEDDTADGPSAARQWAMLGLQVVAGLVVGVGLFLGFTELWRWNVYFALVLAVVVIFGLVTFVHVVRRSSDLVSTLIALAVGLVVTIGPLALLASGS